VRIELLAAFLIFIIIAALHELGVDTTSLIAILGAAGLAIGLALKNSLQNFASGILLILFRPFKIGDFVETAGTTGIVEEVSIFNTIQ
jgi:small conductance mechanosensitive channel